MTDYAGIVPDLAEQLYHAHSSLSSTGARQLLDSPAKFRYAQTHPHPHKAAFDVGSLTHARVLGTGAQIAVIPEDVLASNGAASTTAAKAFVAEARESGQIPVKQDVADAVTTMTENVLAHPVARKLLEQDGNLREVSMFGTCPDTGVEVRCRFDIDAHTSADLKTARDASPKGFAKAVAQHGYDVQQGWYQDVREIVTGDRGRFQFIVVENTAPFLVGVYQLDYNFEDMGKVKSLAARTIYRQCVDAGVWPGYAADVQTLQPPQYAIYDYMEEFEMDEPIKVAG